MGHSRGSDGMYRFLLITACLCAAWAVRHPRSTTLGIENSHLMSGVDVKQILNYPTSGSGHAVFPGDCAGLPKGKPSGLYIVQPEISRRLVVYCDMKAAGGGWTVVQKNSYNTKITWNNAWANYKRGFGDAKGDHWLGNDHIHLLTKQKLYMVRFLLRDAIGLERFADYDLFRLEEETGCYRLRLGRYSGTVPDALTTDVVHAAHDNMKFSTYNQDNDRSQENCASIGGGGWWYDNCRYANLNAKNKIYWQGFCPGNCQSSEILIKPVDVCGDNDNGGGDSGGDNGGGDSGGDNGGGDGGGGDNGGGDDIIPTPCE